MQMKSALCILLTVLVAMAGGAPLEICKHESGKVHIFLGTECTGEAGHMHPFGSGHHHGHEHSHSEHHRHGEHHEPCTHEVIELKEDIAPAPHRIVGDPLTVPHLLPFAPVVLLPDLSRLHRNINHSYSRAPPEDPGPPGQFTTTVRLLI